MSLQLLTPAMAGLLSRIQRAQRTPFHALSVADARRAYAVGVEVLDLPRVPLDRVEDLTLPAADGTPRPARLYADTHQPVPALLYLHGGGFVIGGLETHDSLCRQLARRSGGAVVALDYRRAPEHPFPTAVGDAWAAMHALSTGPADLGLADAPLAVGGDSAGGTLRRCARCTRATAACHLLCSCSSRPGPPHMPTRRRIASSRRASCSKPPPSPGTSTTTSRTTSAATGASRRWSPRSIAWRPPA